MKPQIVIQDDKGFHNQTDYGKRLQKSRSYEDLSTVCIIPSRGVIPAKVVQNWLGMMTPMNQKFMRMFMIGMEVGEAYSAAVEFILGHEDLKKWKYILCLEEDNTVPPDGLLKLYESIKNYDAVGGLYWTKGDGGCPMAYGNPNVMPLNFIPQIPPPNTVMRVNGLGQGFTLFKLDMFKDPKFPKPFFKTRQDFVPNVGVACYTQDLYFFENAGKLGYKFAIDSNVLVGHYDINEDRTW